MFRTTARIVTLLAAAIAPLLPTGAQALSVPSVPPSVIDNTVGRVRGVPALSDLVTETEGAGDPASSKLLRYNGGSVQTATKVYLVLWGDEWGADFRYYDYITRLQRLYEQVGGTAWQRTRAEFGMGNGCTIGGTSCTSNAPKVGGATFGQGLFFGGAVPTTPTEAQMAATAREAAVEVGDVSVNAQYVIALPPGHGDVYFSTKGGPYCAWHSVTTVNSKNVSYTSLPYQPDGGYACGQNRVNAGSAGLLDGLTIVAGHELAESQTDPMVSAWKDINNAEDGDKCAWVNVHNAPLRDGTMVPMQPLWSNRARNATGNGCVYS